MEAPVKQIYQILKEYIPAKDIQQATDHLIDDLQEILDEEDLVKLAGIDKYMKNSVTEVLGDYEEDEDEDYEDMY
tara:strand:- start:386 stop:610 length:225 start_codon:yes stop_codon:yes gene_type:complete